MIKFIFLIRVVLLIVIAITSILQFFAIYDYFSIVQDVNGILSFILAIVSCGVPFLGTILGVLGAHDGWAWSWSSSIFLFIWPYVLYLVLSLALLIGENKSSRNF